MSYPEDPHKPANELHEQPTDSTVSITYYSSATKDNVTKTGVKTTDGSAAEAGVIDTGTEFTDGTPRTLRVERGGAVKVEGPKQTQMLGILTDVTVDGDAA